jgi:hypothetical protein
MEGVVIVWFMLGLQWKTKWPFEEVMALQFAKPISGHRGK